jgi:RNA recognition motif-containing protein
MNIKSYHHPSLVNSKTSSISIDNQTTKSSKSKTFYIREIAGKKWIDSSLVEWPINDHRLFVGNLSKDVTDEILAQHFAHYPSLAKTRVIRDKYTKGPKGYGFVSFLDVTDFSRALKQMEGTYIINRPCKLSVSCWNKRTHALVKNGKLQKEEDLKINKSAQLTKLRNVLPRTNKNKHIGGVPNFV